MKKISIVVFALLLQGCANESVPAGLSLPQIVPLIKNSYPDGLKPGKTPPVTGSEFAFRTELDAKAKTQDDSKSLGIGLDNSNGHVAAGYIVNLFQNSWSGIKGYLMSQVVALDSRISVYEGAALKGCLLQVGKPMTLDLSAIDPMLNFTLNNISCYAPLEDASSEGGGEAFGQSGIDASFWVQSSDDFLTQGGHINYANVSNAGSISPVDPEKVSGISIAYTPKTKNEKPGELSITRFIAIPAAKSFEMFYGSSSGAIQSSNSTDLSFLGAGFRMISDGTFVYADGTLCIDPTGRTCGVSSSWQPFNVCLDAATTTVHFPASDCAKLASSFTLNPAKASLDFFAMTGITDFAESFRALGAGPSAENVALVSRVSQIAGFKSVGTEYAP